MLYLLRIFFQKKKRSEDAPIFVLLYTTLSESMIKLNLNQVFHVKHYLRRPLVFSMINNIAIVLCTLDYEVAYIFIKFSQFKL